MEVEEEPAGTDPPCDAAVAVAGAGACGGGICRKLDERLIEEAGATFGAMVEAVSALGSLVAWAEGPIAESGARLARGRDAIGASEVRRITAAIESEPLAPYRARSDEEADDGSNDPRRRPIPTLCGGSPRSTAPRSARLLLAGSPRAPEPASERLEESAADAGGATKLAERVIPAPGVRPGVVVVVRTNSRSLRSVRSRSRRAAVDSLRSPAGVLGPRAVLLELRSRAGNADDRGRLKRAARADETAVALAAGPSEALLAGVRAPIDVRSPLSFAVEAGGIPAWSFAFFCALSSSRRFLSRSAPVIVFFGAASTPWLLLSEVCEDDLEGGASAPTPSRSPSTTVLVVLERFDRALGAAAVIVRVELASSVSGDPGGETERC